MGLISRVSSRTYRERKNKMLRTCKSLLGRMYKRGMGPQNAYNDQPQFINRTVLVSPTVHDNVSINGVAFDPEKHGGYFAGTPVEALRNVNARQTKEGWRALWQGTRRYMSLSVWRRRVAHHTLARAMEKEMIRRVAFLHKQNPN